MKAGDGDLVRVVDRDSRTLGFGLWNARSEIRLRMLTQSSEAPGRMFWDDQISRAVALRRETLGLESVTNAYRVIHAEGDGLSGLDMSGLEFFDKGHGMGGRRGVAVPVNGDHRVVARRVTEGFRHLGHTLADSAGRRLVGNHVIDVVYRDARCF